MLPPERAVTDTRMDDATIDAETAEAARLAALRRYDIVDTPPDGAFDRIATLAARLLDAPFATVSLVDTDRVWFKATHGLEGVTQVGRDPGFCASAILQDQPYVVRDALAHPAAASNPQVYDELGVRFYAAAPIVTPDGHRLGAVDVLDTRARQVSDRDMAMLADLAAIVMDQLELRLSAFRTIGRERNLRDRAEEDNAALAEWAGTLQRTLLPPRLPRVAGLDLACHYYTAYPHQVLGDFYDVFALGDGRWGFFLGDVEGHGPTAAAVTSLARYTLRAAALHHPDPAAGLDELNTALLLDRHSPRFCTVLYGLLAPHSHDGVEITLAGGGHPPALLVDSSGEYAAIEEISPGGMLVGAMPEATFDTCTLHLRAAQTLLLYTDGLIEARPDGEFFGETGLTSFLADRTATDAPTLTAELAELVAGFDPAPADDIALLAFSVPAT